MYLFLSLSDKNRAVGELGMKKITLQHFNDNEAIAAEAEGRPAKKQKEHTKVIRQKFAVGGQCGIFFIVFYLR